MRTALQQLAADAVIQRQLLSGAVVADELALDLEHALATLRGLNADSPLREALLATLLELDEVLEAQTSWDDAALDGDERWRHARQLAQRALTQLPPATPEQAPARTNSAARELTHRRIDHPQTL